ncbi:putative sulfate exporter family transporter [Pseudomonas sp. R3.Fl]|uniref:YeiH family protein n=1 Tax=Pseudomonas sp. R3.Fl TaxID=2928708 RepID=UPI00201DC3B8|nr:putative sulfate exporter family transporter [Pseudomonas sp. R3.Fl]MCL6692102.1 putative sulfate exporter family transporter [Pseudomonas sp. R3.Fl]
MLTRLRRTPYLVPGALLCLLIAGAANLLVRIPAISHLGLGSLTLAILLGLLLGNLGLARFGGLRPGVELSRQQLLRLGVVLYGLRLTFQDIAALGPAALVIDVLMVTSTLLVAGWVGVRWLKLPRESALLIGAGSAICGAAAVMASSPVLRARAEHTAVAVATVVLFGTLAMLLHPLLFAHLPNLFGSAKAFGIFSGSTIHEVAQVVAAGRAMDPAAADAALISKMLRVLLLAPALLCLGRFAASDEAASEGRRRLHIPGFAVAFLLVTGLRSLGLVPHAWLAPLQQLDDVLLGMAMAALGLATRLGDLRREGPKPLLLGAGLFVFLLVGGGLINSGVQHLLG